MKSLTGRFLVALLLWSLTPGLAEVSENVWHLVTAGHLAHAFGHGPGHAPTGAEHGCTGTYHFCSCHPSPAYDLLPTLDGMRTPAPRRFTASFAARRPPDPALAGPEHPPRV